MNNSSIQFLAKGMKKYKRASEMMAYFFKETQKALQNILRKRRSWGKFVPDEIPKVKSTKYWDEYPLINAQVSGKMNGKSVKISIAINWYESDTDYPFYSISFYDPIELTLWSFTEQGKYELTESKNGLIFRPNPDDLERDFNLLIDEFIKALGR